MTNLNLCPELVHIHGTKSNPVSTPLKHQNFQTLHRKKNDDHECKKKKKKEIRSKWLCNFCSKPPTALTRMHIHVLTTVKFPLTLLSFSRLDRDLHGPSLASCLINQSRKEKKCIIFTHPLVSRPCAFSPTPYPFLSIAHQYHHCYSRLN